MKKIAVLIPCYNEALTIAKVVGDVKKELPMADVYVYDNNSIDGTDKVAKKTGAIVRYEKRQGKGNVIRSMFNQIDADCYVMVDGDDTYDVGNIKKMCDMVLNDNIDMVIGDRLSSTYFEENKKILNSFGNRLVRFLINKIFGTNITDIMTGYRSFSKRFVKNFPISSPNFEIETEMTIHAVEKRFYIEQSPVLYRDRKKGSFSKLHPIKDGFKVLLTIFNLFKEYKPLLFFSILSFLFDITFFLMFIPLLFEYFDTGLVPRFPTLIVSLVFLLIGILMLFIGIILDYIKNKTNFFYELLLNRDSSK